MNQEGGGLPGVVEKQSSKKRARAKSEEVSLQDWIESIKTSGEKTFPDDDPVWRYAKSLNLPEEFVALAWQAFKADYTKPGAKKYIDWRAHFLNAVKKNWFKLWWLSGATFELTTAGKQAQLEHEAEARVAA